MTLQVGQVLFIQEVVSQSRISDLLMKEDILDHLCCAVELRMERGQDFETAFEESLSLFSPKGLNEIEEETYLLLHPKIMTMKKLLFGSSLIFSISIAIGIQMKLLHLAGAAELLVAGLCGAGLISLPLVLWFNASQHATKPSIVKRKETLGILSAYLLAASAILKLIHVAPANETMILGTLVFSFGFLPYYFLSLYRKTLAE